MSVGSIKIIEYGSLWKENASGKIYRIFDFCQIGLVRNHCDGVIYQSMDDNKLHATPIATFLARFKFYADPDNKGSNLYRYYDPEGYDSSDDG